MKNLYKYLLAVATVAMAFTSCSKDEISDPSIEHKGYLYGHLGQRS